MSTLYERGGGLTAVAQPLGGGRRGTPRTDVHAWLSPRGACQLEHGALSLALASPRLSGTRVPASNSATGPPQGCDPQHALQYVSPRGSPALLGRRSRSPLPTREILEHLRQCSREVLLEKRHPLERISNGSNGSLPSPEDAQQDAQHLR